MTETVISFHGENELSEVIFHMLKRFGHAFDTHYVSPKELDQTLESVTRNSHYTARYKRFNTDTIRHRSPNYLIVS